MFKRDITIVRELIRNNNWVINEKNKSVRVDINKIPLRCNPQELIKKKGKTAVIEPTNIPPNVKGHIKKHKNFITNKLINFLFRSFLTNHL